MFPQALRLRRDASFLNVNRLVDVIYPRRENNILSCIYFNSFVLQIENSVIFNSSTNAMETNRLKERVFYMSYFDRFTKLKRNDEIEVSVPLISFAI